MNIHKLSCIQFNLENNIEFPSYPINYIAQLLAFKCRAEDKQARDGFYVFIRSIVKEKNESTDNSF